MTTDPPAGSDLLTLPGRLTTRWLGHPLRVEGAVSSTNSEAARWAQEGAPHGAVVVADTQHAGRGRRGRSWHSPPRANIYLSAVLRPELAPRDAPPLSLAAAVAVAETVTALAGERPQVKWPNDVLWRGQKLCGILLEMRSDGDAIDHIVLGIGLNVTDSALPPELAPIATSLSAITGESLDRAEVAAELLARLEQWIGRYLQHGLAPIAEAWTGYAPWIGARVQVRQGEEVVEGVALGLGEGGGLEIRLEGGERKTIAAGEVAI